VDKEAIVARALVTFLIALLLAGRMGSCAQTADLPPGESPSHEAPRKDLFRLEAGTVTKASYKHGEVTIRLVQVKSDESDRFRFLCRAAARIEKQGVVLDEIYYDDIDAVGDSFGLFVPRKQPSPNFFAIVKCGDYDGRLFLIDKKGKKLDLIGGLYFVTEDGRFLFSEYHSDVEGFAVFDLKEGRVLFSSAQGPRDYQELPWIYQWYQSPKGYLFTEAMGEKEKKGVIHIFDISKCRIVTRFIDISQVKDARKVQYDFDPRDYADCLCGDPEKTYHGSPTDVPSDSKTPPDHSTGSGVD
jgi:hypothetical protein